MAGNSGGSDPGFVLGEGGFTLGGSGATSGPTDAVGPSGVLYGQGSAEARAMLNPRDGEDSNTARERIRADARNGFVDWTEDGRPYTPTQRGRGRGRRGSRSGNGPGEGYQGDDLRNA